MKWIEYSEELQGECLAIAQALVPQYILPEEMQGYLNFLKNMHRWDCRYGLVANDSGEFIACGGLGVQQSVATLCWGLVRSDLHKEGIGTFMLEMRLGWADAMTDIQTIELETTQLTFRFFERFGFETTRIKKDHFGPGLDSYAMIKARPFI